MDQIKISMWLCVSQLIWADSGTGLVEKSDLIGGGRSLLARSADGHPTALIVDEDFVYWLDKDRQIIESIHVDGTGRRTVLRGERVGLVVAFDTYKVCV